MVTSPIIVNEHWDEELRQQFNNLMEAMKDIVTVDPNREEGAYEALNQRIYQAVTDKPILASIISNVGVSLLSSACANLNLDTSHDVIKCLIQTYPQALLGPPSATFRSRWIAGHPDEYTYTSPPIFLIARHPQHCVLLPWIAANYTWIIDHRPHVLFELLDAYGRRGRTSYTATTIKQFFDAYPIALTQKNGSMTILHYVLKPFHDQECEVDLFKWMAERCPSSILLETDSLGNTPLHHACRLLATKKGRNSNDICKYLIEKCPASVHVFNDDMKVLPIHYLQRHYDYRVVREVAVCLLREYPETYDIRHPVYGQTPSSFPFIQSIKPYLDEETELKKTVKSLMDSTSSLTEAVAHTNDKLIRSASTVFDSWSTSFINTTEVKINSILMLLQEMCNEGHDYENRERQIQQGIMDMISSLHE